MNFPRDAQRRIQSGWTGSLPATDPNGYRPLVGCCKMRAGRSFRRTTFGPTGSVRDYEVYPMKKTRNIPVAFAMIGGALLFAACGDEEPATNDDDGSGGMVPTGGTAGTRMSGGTAGVAG